MPRLRCSYPDCVFLDDGYCGTTSVELDPDEGCLTYTHSGDIPEDGGWEDKELDEFWDEDEEDKDGWLEEYEI